MLPFPSLAVLYSHGNFLSRGRNHGLWPGIGRRCFFDQLSVLWAVRGRSPRHGSPASSRRQRHGLWPESWLPVTVNSGRWCEVSPWGIPWGSDVGRGRSATRRGASGSAQRSPGSESESSEVCLSRASSKGNQHYTYCFDNCEKLNCNMCGSNCTELSPTAVHDKSKFKGILPWRQ